MTSTERVRRWRAANPERNREQDRRANARYRGTAKGMLKQVRNESNRRGSS